MAESANHSLQRIQTKTTTKITNTNNNGRRRVSRSRAPRSAFTIAEWYAYAKTQANIKNKMAFANAMARTPEHDGTLRLHQEVQRQNNEPRPVSTAPVTHSDFWRLQLPRIQARLNAESFTTWFLPLDARQDNGTVILRAPDAVFQDWLEHNYADLMNEIGLLPRQWELP